MPSGALRVVLAAALAVSAGCRRTVAPVAKEVAPPAPSAPALQPAPMPGPPPAGSQPLTIAYATSARGQIDRWGRPGHGLGGFARRASLLAKLRAGGAPLVHVSAGDALLLPAGQLAYLDTDPAERQRRVELVLGAYAKMGLDALVPGPSDLAFGAAALADAARAAKVPVVCANLADGDGKPMFDADRLVAAGGLQVGVLGLLAAPVAVAGVRMTDAAAAARASIASLRQRGARVVIALVSGTAAATAALAQAAPGIDLVVLGGAGEVTRRPLLTGRTTVVEAGLDGKRLGQIELFVAADGGHAGENRIHDLAPAVGDDRAMADLVTGYQRALRKRAEEGLLAAVDPRLANSNKQEPRQKGGKPMPPLAENWSFGSSAGCVLCHGQQSVQWKNTAHAFSFESLRGKGAASDPECLPCHTTAFLRPGGTRSLATASAYFPDVGCESCHGPSVTHVRTSKKTETRRKVPEGICHDCHGDERTGEAFDIKEGMSLVTGPGHGG